MQNIGELRAAIGVAATGKAGAHLHRGAIYVIERRRRSGRQRRIARILEWMFPLQAEIINGAYGVHVFSRQREVRRAAGQARLKEWITYGGAVRRNYMVVTDKNHVVSGRRRVQGTEETKRARRLRPDYSWLYTSSG